MNWDTLDALWRERHEPQALLELTRALEAVPPEAGTSESYPRLWRLARLHHFLAMQAAEQADDDATLPHYESGAAHAQQAAQAAPHEVEGHFWHGVNLIEAARRRGKVAALRALPVAERHIERAMGIDEEYHHAGPLRVAGRLTHFKPLLLGGLLDRAIDLYRRALQIAPDNSTTLLYYAEALHSDHQPRLARAALEHLSAAPDDPDWRWEQARDRKLAAELLKQLKQV